MRLIDADEVREKAVPHTRGDFGGYNSEIRKWAVLVGDIDDAPTVDAVEVEDKELLKAIKMLIKQYEHSKNSDYVHSPVAHAFYHTWKQLDERRE